MSSNIAESGESIGMERVIYAAKVANISSFIEAMPYSYETKIGAEGFGLSQGQKQRILIARAIYKNPELIFFDEATNALDATNERVIVENLKSFYEGKTVIIVAHRLSTVKNADQLIVFENGEVQEIGTHKELVVKKGNYYRLVKDQLELGG